MAEVRKCPMCGRAFRRTGLPGDPTASQDYLRKLEKLGQMVLGFDDKSAQRRNPAKVVPSRKKTRPAGT